MHALTRVWQATGTVLQGYNQSAVSLTSSSYNPFSLSYSNYFISIAIVAVGALFLFTLFSVGLHHQCVSHDI